MLGLAWHAVRVMLPCVCQDYRKEEISHTHTHTHHVRAPQCVRLDDVFLRLAWLQLIMRDKFLCLYFVCGFVLAQVFGLGNNNYPALLDK